MRQAFERRLTAIFPKLQDIPGFNVIRPQGAFYLLPDVSEAAAKTGYASVDDFVTALLTEANVAVIPGSGFGAHSTIRLSYATSLETLTEAVERIHQFVTSKWKD